MSNIYQKLHAVRKHIKASKLIKDGTNTYSKYDYFTPETVEKLVSEACDTEGMITICNLKADEHGLYQELDFIEIATPENHLVFHLRTAEADMTATNRAQKMGGTDTYSERYIKMKVFVIKDNSLDFDAQDNRPAQPAAAPVKPVTPAVPATQPSRTYTPPVTASAKQVSAPVRDLKKWTPPTHEEPIITLED